MCFPEEGKQKKQELDCERMELRNECMGLVYGVQIGFMV